MGKPSEADGTTPKDINTSPFTDREIKYLQCLADGLESRAEIAENLKISIPTVKTLRDNFIDHASFVFIKEDIATPTGLVRYALAAGTRDGYIVNNHGLDSEEFDERETNLFEAAARGDDVYQFIAATYQHSDDWARGIMRSAASKLGMPGMPLEAGLVKYTAIQEANRPK
ncbi:MAG TPA: LuxR C-terminal-related transcriptional regulator [Patescibacteria group bacterium]|nr:LuxR C-terminal-related transcriptional regulator [Patescibacteria group bacterium]